MITVMMMIVVVLSLLMVASLELRHAGRAAVPARPGLERRPGRRPGGRRRLPLYRLQQDQDYLQYSATSPPTPANVAFTGWHNIPGLASRASSTTASATWPAEASSRWSRPAGSGVSSAPSGPSLRRRGFLDYLYLTDYESLDPQSGYYSDPTTATSPVRRATGGQGGRPATACRISFVTGDTINGPLHTNDTISVGGSPSFNGEATTATPGR